jgi:restriction system protein
MRLKMADNSLFAILLRSSWWIGLAIALTVVVLSRAVLPETLWIYGAFGGLPFVVVSALAARRQWPLPSARQVATTIDACRAMSRIEFAEVVARAMRRNGHVVETRSGSATDFIVEKAGRRTLVGCHRWKAARSGIEPLRELQAEVEKRDAHDAIFVALGEISDAAGVFAASHGIRVMRDAELARLLRGVMPR